jgi:hypothetical protein
MTQDQGEVDDVDEVRERPAAIFDRYFIEALRPDLRLRYLGRQDFGYQTDPQAQLLSEISEHLNSAFSRQWPTIISADKPKGLHFDYVKATVENAIAFQYDHHAFVGLTVPLADRIVDTCQTVAVSPTINALVRPGWAGPIPPAQISTAFFGIQLQFIACHELGHHFHGHQSENPEGLFEEFSSAEEVAVPSRLDKQAREVDADGYSVHMVLNNLFSGEPRDKTLKLLGWSRPTENADAATLKLFLLAVGAYFYTRPFADFSAKTVDSLTHPFALARMNVVMHEVREWARKHSPHLLRRTKERRFEQLMAAIEQALPSPPKPSVGAPGVDWHQQGRFLRSAQGREYWARLFERRSTLRAEMADRRWMLLQEIDDSVPEIVL